MPSDIFSVPSSVYSLLLDVHVNRCLEAKKLCKLARVLRADGERRDIEDIADIHVGFLGS